LGILEEPGEINGRENLRHLAQVLVQPAGGFQPLPGLLVFPPVDRPNRAGRKPDQFPGLHESFFPGRVGLLELRLKRLANSPPFN